MSARRSTRGDWEDGASVAEWLWEWLREYGIDPQQVDQAAAEQARGAVKTLTDADAELDRLKRGGEELGKIAVFLMDLIRDAFQRGADDPVGALHMLGDYLANLQVGEGGLPVDEHNRVYRALKERQRDRDEKAEATV